METPTATSDAPVIRALNARLSEMGGLVRYAMANPYAITEVRPVEGGWAIESNGFWFPCSPKTLAGIAEQVGLTICLNCGPNGQAHRLCWQCGVTYCKWCEDCNCGA